MSCLLQPGASYHESPIKTSSLPSLFTSPIPAPSDRNLPSTTAFFHEIGLSDSPARMGAVAGRMVKEPRTVVRKVRISMIVDPSDTRGVERRQLLHRHRSNEVTGAPSRIPRGRLPVQCQTHGLRLPHQSG